MIQFRARDIHLNVVKRCNENQRMLNSRTVPIGALIAIILNITFRCESRLVNHSSK